MLYPDKFTRTRNRSWHRMRAQAIFRGEAWDMDFATFCEFWPDEKIWEQRGRGTESLCMTRLDPDGVWNRTNAIVLPRIDQARYKNALFWGRPSEQHLARARHL
jgi:hypothetical protein